MFSISNKRIKLTRGDSATIAVDIKCAGQKYDYSNDTVVFTVKKTTKDRVSLIRKEVTDGIVKLEPNDTSRLAYGLYKYDIQLTTVDGDVYTVIPPSDFILDDEVTY